MRFRCGPGPAWTGVFAFIVVACAPRGQEAVTDRIAVLEDSIGALTEALGTAVDLRPGDPSFSILRLDVGAFALTLDSVRAGEGGSLLSMAIANLTSAEIDEIAATIWWGQPAADGTHPVTEEQSRILTLPQRLAPGTWTRVSFALDSVAPDQIGFLRIADASATGLRLPVANDTSGTTP